MIIPMKKATIVCMAADRNSCLEQLHELGVLHVTVGREERESLQATRHQLADAELALRLIPEDVETGSAEDQPDATSAIARAIEIRNRQREIDEQIAGITRVLDTYAPFGEVDPEQFARLADNKISIRLFRCPASAEPLEPGSGMVKILSEDRQNHYGVLIGDVELPPEEYNVVPLPEDSTKALTERHRTLTEENARLCNELCALAAARAAIEREMLHRSEQHEFAVVQSEMQQDRAVAYLQGYVPVDKTAKLEKAATERKWALLLDDPAPEDTVPTLIRTPRWVKPIKAVFDVLKVCPGYREADTSMVFLLFFSVFFAILIGDAGYGLLFLAATIFARKKLPKAPAYPFTLMGVLSVSTIIWGVLNATYFGIQPSAGTLWIAQIPWLGSAEHIMQLCFIIGAVHLTIAHVWNAVVLFPAPKAFAQIGWIGVVWSTFFAACNMVLQKAYPGWILPVFLVSIILVMLFMTAPKDLKSQWIDHVMLPLSVVNSLVDVISYVRLFAVGMASVSVAQSFNDMASDMGMPLPLKIPIVALILLLGHGLNIVLGALAILVHAVRLNTLEFSQHKGLEWSGFAYKPFGKANRD